MRSSKLRLSRTSRKRRKIKKKSGKSKNCSRCVKKNNISVSSKSKRKNFSAKLIEPSKKNLRKKKSKKRGKRSKGKEILNSRQK